MGAQIQSLRGPEAASSAGAPPTGAPVRRTHLRDAALVAIVTIATWVLCGIFDVTETLRRLNAPYERYQLDELPSVLLVLGLGLTWFATRRYGEARQEIARRLSAEAQLAEALADNRRLAQQYVELQETERKALARELHDELGQYLNVIKLDAVGIRDDGQVQAAVHRRARAIVENCNHIHGAVAALMRELRPTGLDELGLAAALEHCVETWRAGLPGVSLQLSMTGDFAALPESITVTLYRLVQEALTNVAKHAAASHVTVRLERVGAAGTSDDRIDAAVVDDGVGAAPGRVPTRGLGLIGMRERVMALQGRLVFTSWPGRGFELSAQIPVPPDAGQGS